MNKYLTTTISTLILSSYLSAACVYVDCSDSVTAATQQVQQEMQTEFSATQTQLNTLDKNYKEYSDALKKNNELYEKNKVLKEEYLILLKIINHKTSTLKLIESTKANEK